MVKKKVYSILTDYGKIPLIAVLSWILFDLANSFFQLGISTLYYPLWIVQDMGVKELHYGIVLAIAQTIIILSAPVLGAFSDKHHKKRFIVIFFTLQAVVFASMLSISNVFFSLIFFLLTYIGVQIGQIFYDSFLIDVSTKKNRGLISGIGIASGQLGYIIIILLMIPVVTRFGRDATFLPMSFLFLMCALPAFMFLKQKKSRKAKPSFGVRDSFKRVLTTLRNLKDYPGTLRFFVSRFFYLDAMQSVYTFAAIYGVLVLKFNDLEIQSIIVSIIIFAVVGGLTSGFFIDRIGAKKFMNIILIMLFFGLGSLMVATSKAMVLVFGIVLGLVQGCIWSVDRVIITRLSPHKQLGEFFGLYGMLNRFANIVGPLLWGSIVFLLEDFGTQISHRAAVGSLMVLVVISIIVFIPLKIPR